MSATSQHDSRPSIAAWPTPLPAENVLTVKPRLKDLSKIDTNLCTETKSSLQNSSISLKRISILLNSKSSTNLSLAGALSPPYTAISPQHSPREQQNKSSNFHQDSSKLLAMLKVVAASSSSK